VPSAVSDTAAAAAAAAVTQGADLLGISNTSHTINLFTLQIREVHKLAPVVSVFIQRNLTDHRLKQMSCK